MAKISEIPYSNWTHRVGERGYAIWDTHDDGVGGTYEGANYVLPEGIVEIYIQGGEKATPHTRLDFVYRGIVHTRAWKHRFTKPTAKRLARQFIADVIKAHNP